MNAVRRIIVGKENQFIQNVKQVAPGAAIVGYGEMAGTIDDERSADWGFKPSTHAGAYCAVQSTRIVAAANRGKSSLDAPGARNRPWYLRAKTTSWFFRQARVKGVNGNKYVNLEN